MHDFDVQLRIRHLAGGDIAGAIPDVVGNVRRVLAFGNHDQRVHPETLARECADLAHKAQKRLQTVVPTGESIVAWYAPDHVVRPVLVDLRSISGCERRVCRANSLWSQL